MKVSKDEALSEDEIREMFSPRALTNAGFAKPERTLGIVRAVKKGSFTGDSEVEAKDFLVDEHEGLIGSQG
jgi:hypothetical protein